MIVKMSAITALYVLLTVLIWLRVKKRPLDPINKITIGIIYGLLSVLSTHYGVNYNHMMLNVRDIGPLVSGLFFSPVSGIIAGLIGGIERYIAGTYWEIGSYTRIACSVSTCLAGFLSALMTVFLFKRKKPNLIYAFLMGSVMEVFHMYVVLITHRDDMSMALYVVKTCSGPMIIFTGIGLALSSMMIMILAGEWRNPLHLTERDKRSVSEKFQFWQFIVTASVLIFNLLFSFYFQKQTAVQNAKNTLLNSADDIRKTYSSTISNMEALNENPEKIALTEAQTLAAVVESSGSPEGTDNATLDRICSILGLRGVFITDSTGTSVMTNGQARSNLGLINSVLAEDIEGKTSKDSDGTINACVRCFDGLLVISTDPNQFSGKIDMSTLSDVLTYFHVGNKGTFDIIYGREKLQRGSHSGTELSPEDKETLQNAQMDAFFNAKLFGARSLCRLENLGDGISLLVLLPYSEVFEQRDAQMYELAFADILLFAVIYVLIALLVQQIVVKNLSMVNVSLTKITGGDLNEVVDVHSSSEFASLSKDINMTVDTLKGYIDAAEKRIEQELVFARTIQESSLPKNFSFPRSDFEIYASMDPAKEVGGDFYDFFFIDINKIALVIADVSGKGIPASLFMMRSKTALRGLAESGQSPREILLRANNTLSEGNDADMFVTVWLGIVDLTTGLMTCANAGHEYPVLKHKDGDFEVYKDKHGLALAAMPGVKYREYEIQLEPGDRLFVYTDGIPEAIDENTEQYGMERLIEALNPVKDEPMSEILPTVRKNIADFVGEAPQFDDITMLGFTFLGSEKEEADKEEQ